MKGRIVIVYVAIFTSLLFSFDVFAGDILVSTPVTAKNINSAIASAQPGDCVIIPDGTYGSLNQIVVPSNIDGTEANPITLKPATVGGVTFTGDPASPLIFIQGDWWIIRNFKFIDVSEVGDANTKGIYTRDATGTRVTNNYFEGFGVLTDANKRSWCIRIGHSGTGNYSRVDYNTFIRNEAVHIAISYGSKYCRVDHNYLKDSLKDGTNGFEGVQVGDGGNSVNVYTTVEYNLFENMSADGETISNKSSSNTYQYNVFKSTGSATAYGLVLRGGDDCITNGNYFFDVDKHNIRVHGTGHKIINNYFENPGYSAILLAEGNNNVTYANVSDISILNNTIVNPEATGIHIGWWPSGDVKPNNLTFKNNIITSNVAGSYLVRDNGHTGIFTWTTNLHYATGTASEWRNDGSGNKPGSGITHANPNLLKGLYIYRLQASSTNAINKGVRNINVTTDIDGDLREASPDIGCDEFFGTIRRPMSESEVGVSWLRQGTLKPPTDLKVVML